MKSKRSNLILNEFVIVKSSFEFIPPEEEISVQDTRNIISAYPVEIDFGIASEDLDHIVMVSVEINPDRLCGYSIFAQGMGSFSFDKDFSEDEKLSLLHYSAVSICITNIRAFIADITSNYPVGKFNFHSVDMNDLIKQKAKENLP